MTAAAGRIEAAFAISGVQNFTNAAGTIVFTPAASYAGVTDLIADLAAQLGAGWSVGWSSGEGPVASATGKVTIDSATHYPFTVTWTNTALRDILGFTGNLAAVSAPQTGTKHVIGAWLPAIEKFSRHGDRDAGTPQTDLRYQVSPAGDVNTLFGNSFNVLDGLRWVGVPGQRVRQHLEAVVNESFEAFFRNCQLGGNASFAAGAAVRLYWSAADATHYATGTLLHRPKFDPDTMITGWVGRYVIELPRMIVSASV
jgi:hypothetical protein